MGSIVTKVKYGDVAALRERYISNMDYKVFQMCGIDDSVITDTVFQFSKVDAKNKGRIDLAQFYFMFGLDVKFITPMAKRVFLCFDIDRKGKITFAQCLTVIVNIALATTKDLLNFTFDCYWKSLFDKNDEMAQRDDKGHDGRSMRLEMMQTLFDEAFGTRKLDTTTREVLKYMKDQPYRKQMMTKHEFFQYVKKNRKVIGFWTIFALQEAIRKGVFGLDFWEAQMGGSKPTRPPGLVPGAGNGLEDDFVKRSFDRADPDLNNEYFRREHKAKLAARANRSYRDEVQAYRGKVRY